MTETGKQDSEPFLRFHAECSRAFLCTGTVPASIRALTNLQRLDLDGNAGLSGMSVVPCVCSVQHSDRIESTPLMRLRASSTIMIAECSLHVFHPTTVTEEELQQYLPGCEGIFV